MEKTIVNGISINVYPHDSPIAIAQIAHGMEEHQGRYRALAEFLNSRGFAVVTCRPRWLEAALRGSVKCAGIYLGQIPGAAGFPDRALDGQHNFAGDIAARFDQV